MTTVDNNEADHVNEIESNNQFVSAKKQRERAKREPVMHVFAKTVAYLKFMT